MKNKKFKIIVPVLKIIVCFGFVVYLFFAHLLCWNQVLHFKNFIYLSHPLSKDACSNMHHTTLDAEITFTNDGSGVSKERYSFSIDKQLKDSAIARPQVMTVDTFAAFLCPSVNDNCDVSLGIDLLKKAEQKSPSVNQEKYNGVDLYKGGNQNSYIIHKNNILGYTDVYFWAEEDHFIELLKSIRKWELNEFRTSIFRFDDDDLLVNTYYGIGCQADSAVVIQNKEVPFQKIRRFFCLFFAPYDISKAQYDCTFMAHELDSTNINIKFAEGVDISVINHPRLVDCKPMSDGLVFRNLGIHVPKGINESFIQNFDGKSKTIVFNGWEFRNYKENEALTFYVKYLDSRNIQWIRLFFLTTIIAYLFTLIVKYCKQLYKGNY